MPLTLDIVTLEEPLLEFGQSHHFSPTLGLTAFGPLSLQFGVAHKENIRVGLVGPEISLSNAKRWFERCQNYISSGLENKKLHPDFPGFEAAFRSQFNLSNLWEWEIKTDELENALSGKPQERFAQVLELYTRGIHYLAKEQHTEPDVVVVCISEEIIAKCRTIDIPKASSSEQRNFQKQKDGNVPLPGLEDLVKVEDRLLHQNFRRALKARAMLIGIPIQLGTDNLFLDRLNNENPASRAWNVCLALFYKAGGLPWRLKTLSPDTCYVGISFHRYQSKQRSSVFPSLAQAFPATGEGFVMRGDIVSLDPNSDERIPHLKASQASDLAKKVVEEYRNRVGSNPLRMVIYKTSKFNPDEEQGFRDALSSTALVELVNLRPSEFRLVRRGVYPPSRGTIAIVNDTTFNLFTNGYFANWGTYMGAHIPVPYEINILGSSDPIKICSEIMGLTKLNWNTARDFTSTPIPIHFAKEVGSIISHFMDLTSETNVTPNPSYRFYM